MPFNPGNASPDIATAAAAAVVVVVVVVEEKCDVEEINPKQLM